MKNDNKMKLKELLKKQPLKEATMHHMTRENTLDSLKEIIYNIKPYSKEVVKLCEKAIAIVEKFEPR